MLKRLFVNLIVNSIKYTNAGGAIELSIEKNSEKDKIDLDVVCTIKDTGIEIPKKSLPYIFDRFYRVDKSRTEKTGGSGLGLIIVKKILELHNGKVKVKSRMNKGASFSLFFPEI